MRQINWKLLLIVVGVIAILALGLFTLKAVMLEILLPILLLGLAGYLIYVLLIALGYLQEKKPDSTPPEEKEDNGHES